MKKLVFLLSVIFVTMSSFTVNGTSHLESSATESVEEYLPSCFSDCVEAGEEFREEHGLGALDFLDFVTECNNTFCANE